MSVSTGPVICATCKQQLDESADLLPQERLPCPSCGSKTRIFSVEVRETITPRSKLGLKHKRPGFKKPIYEEVSGEDLHRKTGLWSRLLRVIDRQNNRYKEAIVNSETGEVLRAVDEPLSDHIGRGSDKKSRQRE
jgi:DNA-directed RNA polymerase subunit RPC12/RpoP